MGREGQGWSLVSTPGCCVSLGKLLYLSEPQFLLLKWESHYLFCGIIARST